MAAVARIRHAPSVAQSKRVNIMYYDHLDTPIGRLLLIVDAGGALRHVGLPSARKPLRLEPEWEQDEERLAPVVEQFDDWFGGRRRQFDLPLTLCGTPFQRAVWQALAAIPYAATCSYAELARAVGRPRAVRAVGAANGANPLSIVLPCHRVVGTDGSLTGYGGGLEAKRWLLDHETRHVTHP